MREDTWRVLRLSAAVVLIAAAALYTVMRKQTPQLAEYRQIEAPEHTAVTELTVSAETGPSETTVYRTEAAVTTGQTESGTITETKTPDTNLNTADAADLERVSGVGAVLADAIVAYRAQIGGFTRRSQLKEISGIGEVLAERIMAEFYIPDELPPETVPPPVQTAPAETVGTETVPPQPEIPAEGFDLNAVTREELLLLPDMTEAKADGILAVRDILGRYNSVYELVLSDEISDAYFTEVLRNYLYVTGDPAIVPQE